jgi:hypothetical protein
MPIGLDLTQQIVNVSWEAGVVFVAGGYGAFVLYANIKSKDDLSGHKVFSDLGDLDAFIIEGDATSAPSPNIGGGSCKAVVDSEGNRKITFVLGGNVVIVDESTGSVGSGSVIMVSHNGNNWTRAFRKQWPDYVGNDSRVMAFALDAGKFYGRVSSTEYYFPEPDHHTATKLYDRLLVSSDGVSWSEAAAELRDDSDENYPDPPVPNSDPPAPFMVHLNPVAKLPDGKYGYYEKKDSGGVIVESYLAIPTKFDEQWYLNDLINFTAYDNSIDVTILKDGTKTTATKTVPMTYVTCVTYADGILMAGGALDLSSGDFRARIASSIDDGATWQVVWQAPDGSHQVINTITSASLSTGET